MKNFGGTGSNTPKNPQKEGVVHGFPAKLEKHKTIDISVNWIHIDTKLELCMESIAIPMNFRSEVIYHPKQDGGGGHLENRLLAVKWAFMTRF